LEKTAEKTSEKTAYVERHDLLFRVLHWTIVAEGILLTLTGFQLGGGLFGVTFFPSNNYSYHVMLGIAVIATVTLFVYNLVATGEFYWFGAKQIPNALRYVMAESKAWFKLGPEPKNPIHYDPTKKAYAFKIIPSVVTSFLGFVILGALLMFTGVMLAFPSQFFFLYYVTDPIGSFFTGVSGMPFVLAIHRFIADMLVVLVAVHIYAGFIFKLVKSVITGKRNEPVL
jgi:cytochrome b subunit of formate dehydrogenase